MKKLIIVFALSVCLCLSGCNDSGSHTEEDPFVRLYGNGFYGIYYHKDTKVMYLHSNEFTVMVDADGKPLLWRNPDVDH